MAVNTFTVEKEASVATDLHDFHNQESANVKYTLQSNQKVGMTATKVDR